jgi:hypothetical protein
MKIISKIHEEINRIADRFSTDGCLHAIVNMEICTIIGLLTNPIIGLTVCIVISTLKEYFDMRDGGSLEDSVRDFAYDFTGIFIGLFNIYIASI